MTIYKNRIKFSSLLLFLVLVLPVIPAFGLQAGHVEYDDLKIDYSKLNRNKIQTEANFYFNKSFGSVDQEDHDKYIDTAMRNYYILTKIDSENVFPFVQLARIYDDKSKNRLAKEYFFKATNLNVKDAYANFYFGEFYFKRHDYKRALFYYNAAYNNGFNNRYELNLRLATIYEKFADLVNAKRFYDVSYSMKPDETELKEKINSLNGLNYESSEYYHYIRE